MKTTNTVCLSLVIPFVMVSGSVIATDDYSDLVAELQRANASPGDILRETYRHCERINTELRFRMDRMTSDFNPETVDLNDSTITLSHAVNHVLRRDRQELLSRLRTAPPEEAAESARALVEEVASAKFNPVICSSSGQTNPSATAADVFVTCQIRRHGRPLELELDIRSAGKEASWHLRLSDEMPVPGDALTTWRATFGSEGTTAGSVDGLRFRSRYAVQLIDRLGARRTLATPWTRMDVLRERYYAWRTPAECSAPRLDSLFRQAADETESPRAEGVASTDSGSSADPSGDAAR